MPTKEDLYDQAIDLIAEGHSEEAVSRYREALAIDPDFLDAWTGLALALAELKRFEEAIEAGKKLIDLDPDDPLSYTNLSRFYQQMGNVPEAEAWAAKARIADWKQQLRESDNKE
jgi:Flp pilus assembly protein TadD